MSTTWFSLRRRLLALLLGGVAVAWLVTMVFSFIDVHHEVDELFDAQLAQSAQTLLALAGHEEEGDIDELDAIAHRYQRRMQFQIWRADGKLLIRSKKAPKTPLTASDGFSDAHGEQGRWRRFSQWNDERSLQVQVSENHHFRDELIGHIAWRLLLPALFGLPLIGFWVWLATRHGLASLEIVAREIASRDPQQLQAISPAAAPEEIRTIVEALNGLLTRVENALAAERRFTADAAHELRTPLAALQAQLQVAMRARDSNEREHSFEQLQGGLVRASRLVDQMLQLARLDPESGLPDPAEVDLGKLAESVCAELGTLILARKLDFALDAGGGCLVNGQADWLRVLIRNLVDNAIRYTPECGRVRVSVAREEDRCTLCVSDSGAGIPAHERDAARRRFHRLNDGGEAGSGLGLAIVARIAELHGGALTLADNDQAPGLLASVTVQVARATRETPLACSRGRG